MSNTSPALDLTLLFNGFKPLFAALSPDDVNKLAYEIITVFQGEGGTLESLLAHTASVTTTLAGRDQVIGDLIEQPQRGDGDAGRPGRRAVRPAGQAPSVRLWSRLGPRRRSSAHWTRCPRWPGETSQLVTGIRPSLTEDISQLRKVAGNLDRNKAEVDRALQVLPVKLTKIGRTASYGSFFNFYLCNFDGRVKLPGRVHRPGRLRDRRSEV